MRCADWSVLREPASQIRSAVFILEQKVPAELEWDDEDAQALHCVIERKGEPLATGRLLPDGRIGRMAVQSAWRGCGLGGRVLERLVSIAFERGHTEVRLSAQCHAEGFYRAHGFEPVGEVYEDAGIAHRDMRRAAG